MRLTIEDLKNNYEGAKANNMKYVGMAFIVNDEALGLKGITEITVYRTDDFEPILKVYSEQYGPDKNNPDILSDETESFIIRGFTYGNSFADIERDLIG